MISDCTDGQLDHLQYRMSDVITILDKKYCCFEQFDFQKTITFTYMFFRPNEYPDGYYWKGIMANNRTGLFLPTNAVTYLGINVLPAQNFSRQVGQSDVMAASCTSLQSNSGGLGNMIGSLRASFTHKKR